MAIAADHTASPSLGSDWLLASFVAPAIAGRCSRAALSRCWTFLAACCWRPSPTALLLVGIDNFWITVFLGVVLLLAVCWTG